MGVAICCVYVPLDRSEGIRESDDSAHESEIESDNGSANYETENEFGEESLNESAKDFIEFESSISTELACVLAFGDGFESPPNLMQDLQFGTNRKSYHYGDASEQMWVTLYHKVAIMEMYRSYQFTSLEAEFLAPYKNCKVLKCGFHPIYSYDPMVHTRDVDVSCFDCQMNVENLKLCLKGHPNPINHVYPLLLLILSIPYVCETAKTLRVF